MTEIKINLSNADNIYRPGQILHGTVELILNTPKDVNGFHILITGEANSYWTEINSSKTQTTYRGNETYLRAMVNLIVNERVPAGKRFYPFACALPTNIPESYALPCGGQIAYNVKAVLDVPWKFDKKISVPFLILRNDSLHDFPELRQPVNFMQEQQMGGCCSGDGLCKMTVFIPNCGYAPGEKIPIKIECENESTVDIKSITIKLIQQIEVVCTKPNRKTKSTLPETLDITRVEGVEKGIFKSQEVLLQIPLGLLSSNERFCKIITIKYFISIYGKTKWYNFAVRCEIPITIIRTII